MSEGYRERKDHETAEVRAYLLARCDTRRPAVSLGLAASPGGSWYVRQPPPGCLPPTPGCLAEFATRIRTGNHGTKESALRVFEHLFEAVWPDTLPGHEGLVVLDDPLTRQDLDWTRVCTPRFVTDVSRLSGEMLATWLLGPRDVAGELTGRREAGKHDACHTPARLYITIDAFMLDGFTYVDVGSAKRGQQP